MADSGSSLTPEKRLLNLIESGGKANPAEPVSGSGGSSVPHASPTRPAMAGMSGPAGGFDLHSFVANLSENTRLWTDSLRKRFGLKAANQIARFVLILFVLGAFGSAAYEHYVAGKNPLDGLDAPAHQLTPVSLDEEDKSAAQINVAESRNVFLPFAKREEVQQVSQKSESGRMVEMTKVLKLTGISFNPADEKATYCMIEDLAKNITVFLRVGDRINGMRVSQIRDESIELEYENDKIEIR